MGGSERGEGCGRGGGEGVDEGEGEDVRVHVGVGGDEGGCVSSGECGDQQASSWEAEERERASEHVSFEGKGKK